MDVKGDRQPESAALWLPAEGLRDFGRSDRLMSQTRPNGELVFAHATAQAMPLHQGRAEERSVAARRPASARALALLSLADFQGSAVEVGAIQRLNCARGVGTRHLHEAEATRTTRVAIGYQRNLLDCTVF
jgi:hypothetical protein